MKLTNTIRDAFVRAAMNDVPKIDFEEEYRKVMTADAVAQLPPAVRKLWNDKALRDYVHTDWAGSRYGRGFSARVPGRSDHKPSEEAIRKGAELYKKHEEQNERHSALRADLRAAAYGATTRKQLAEMLPEFVKYLPADEAAANRSVPVVANIVADFVKAGWPKGGAKAAA
ncbi:Nmad5 family putative nucleotide modification protein [Paracidovorax citrulli]|uniref:Nmad5 family putative nucleotide modification protein n=1 Tax=Paracidovorax citrulli TaxID=80869 RepID=UPI0005FBAF0C|nr:Nmad5 family putative nucleotide modification protein [Paracidovorax citrulli]UMT88353.1 hypothetical protein FRC90_09915 [Paracidovorax citrulli]WIY32739.1 Nmad5 family putative nucleotide modification protein [Paracidovorax citrulli]SDJ32228.1 hypothetical protein SAMN04489709_10398 [Paracidovorax citrulli]